MNLMDLISGGQGNPLEAIKALLSPQDAQPQLSDGAMPGAPSMPTDLSARARTPDSSSIPLPVPRPPEAPQSLDPATSSAITSFAPTDPQRMSQGMPLIPTGDSGKSGLLSLIAPGLAPDGATRRNIEASLGGGLSSVTGNTAGGAFARGMGGGLKAGNKSESEEFDHSLKALKAVQEAKSTGTSEEYKTALTNYYKTLTQQKNDAAAKAAAPVNAKVATTKPAAATPEISMKGDGTQGSPYAPTSKDDYDQIESGSYYVHPTSGQLRLKK